MSILPLISCVKVKQKQAELFNYQGRNSSGSSGRVRGAEKHEIYTAAFGGHLFYRPQTKFAKVMFLQVSVCPHWGGACVVLFGGHAWFYSGVCVVLFRGGMHGFIWGACVLLFGGHVWLYSGGLHGFIQEGGMHGFIRGGVRGFIWGHV